MLLLLRLLAGTWISLLLFVRLLRPWLRALLHMGRHCVYPCLAQPHERLISAVLPEQCLPLLLAPLPPISALIPLTRRDIDSTHDVHFVHVITLPCDDAIRCTQQAHYAGFSILVHGRFGVKYYVQCACVAFTKAGLAYNPYMFSTNSACRPIHLNTLVAEDTGGDMQMWADNQNWQSTEKPHTKNEDCNACASNIFVLGGIDVNDMISHDEAESDGLRCQRHVQKMYVGFIGTVFFAYPEEGDIDNVDLGDVENHVPMSSKLGDHWDRSTGVRNIVLDK
ncbi:hypothetical protein CAPTEDRAFT_213233 [Capitella teleta]|uniref:Uncharacterized protein n=1 Tax=Capitella teleta TaxID=283909 RepID=R7UQE2_CAPTE|nr:hypothetical protein CAPTEDRAFT_213233 [Capitella teleta]|eukprot:ELU08333.1 hypothetical protein CAPTEDRAFT_213233 [Capitella teleta]